jgi:hypothetical protein
LLLRFLFEMNEPAYYDSQASAAAALQLEVYTLRDAKRDGCPAFRSGRVYRGPLLEWFAAKKARVLGGAGDPGKEIRQAILDSALQYQREEINFQEFFDRTTLLVEQLGNQAILHEWIRQVFAWLENDFPELSDAYKAHPKIVDWLCRQGGAKYRAPRRGRRVSQK